jgi:hypothetical protein
MGGGEPELCIQCMSMFHTWFNAYKADESESDMRRMWVVGNWAQPYGSSSVTLGAGKQHHFVADFKSDSPEVLLHPAPEDVEKYPVLREGMNDKGLIRLSELFGHKLEPMTIDYANIVARAIAYWAKRHYEVGESWNNRHLTTQEKA